MFFLLIVLAAFFFPQPAMAYLDPASGSYLVQAAFGLILSFALSVRAYFSALSKKAESLRKSIAKKPDSKS